MNKSFSKLTMTILALLFFACAQQLSRNQDMIDLLSDAETRAFSPQNNFSPEAKLKFYDSSLKTAYSYPDSMNLGFVTARTFLELGNEEQAIEILRNLLQRVGSEF